MFAKQHMKKLKRTKNIVTSSSTFVTRNKLTLKWSVTVTLNMTNFWKTFRKVDLVNADMDCSTSSICINVRERQRALKNRSCSWCPGVQIPLKWVLSISVLNLAELRMTTYFRSRRRCCTQALSTLLRNHWWAYRNTFKPRISQKHHEKLSKRNCEQLTVSKATRTASYPIFLRTFVKANFNFCMLLSLSFIENWNFFRSFS